MSFFRKLVVLLAAFWLATNAHAASHGIGPITTVLPKTVLNMDFGADQFANIATNFGISLSGTATPANLSSDEFPSGVLPNTINSNQTALPSNYYGHYSLVSTGISGLQWLATSIIVYSGGQQVYPGLSSGFGTSIGNTTFINSGPWNIELAFGDLVATVQNSTTTPGLVELISKDANGFETFNTGGLTQVHNVANLSATTVWTITKINNTTIDLQGSSWNSSMVPATGNPGTAAEAINNPGSITPFWEANIPGLGNVNHTITSLIFCKTADLASVQAGQNISSAAISFINSLHPKWLRFMDMIGVQAVSGQFQYLPAITNIAPGVSQHWQPKYFGGTTTSTGDNFSVNGGPSSPASGPINDGEVIEFVADHTSGQLPTLTINGRSGGPKPILKSNSTYLYFETAGQPSGSTVSSITGSGTVATVTTTTNHGFNTGQLFITNVSGNTPSAYNVSHVLATATGVNTFTYPTQVFSVTGAVTGTTNPGQCKITTSASNPYAVGNTVVVSSIGGATGCNGTNTISAIDSPSSFELTGTTFGGTYTSGGTVGIGGTTSVAGTFTPQVADGDILNLTFTASNFSGGAYTAKYYVNLTSTSFTSTVVGTTLTVSAIGSGRVTPGQVLTGSGLTHTATILPYGSGGTTGTGGTGTYALNITTGGTVTGAISRTGSSCGTGVVNSVVAMTADMVCVLLDDPTLGGQQLVFGNNGGVGVGVLYAPAIAQITPSVTITQAGGTAEIITPSYGGGDSNCAVSNTVLCSGTIYTAQYRASAGGWITSSGPLTVGIALGIMKEYAQRTGAGIWYNVSMAWSQASATSFGTYLANNFPGVKIHLEIENELWNTGQGPNHAAQGIGTSMGFPGVNGSVYFQSIYSVLGWSIENISQTIVNAYVTAGGSRSNIFVGMIMSGADGGGCTVTTGGCVGGQTGGVQTAFLGTQLTPTPATFTGTINPSTNGIGATLTVTGISGVLYSGYQINGTGVTAGTHISSCLPSVVQCTGNGTYQLDTAYGSTVGPIAMTATNVVYSAVGGPGATPTTSNFTAFPNRPIDLADDVGYATYYGGVLAGEGSGSWSGSSPTPYAALLQASADYAHGLATSNTALMQSGLNAWSADVNGKAIANTTAPSGNHSSNNICGFLESPTTLGFCNNNPNAVITGSIGGTSTLTVTSVTSGVVKPGMIIAIGGGSSVPVIQAYGTGGTTGTGGAGTYALSTSFTGSCCTNTTIGIPVGVVQGWENIIKAFDGARPSGKANLGVLQYEGSLQQAFCPGACPVGNIFLSIDPTTLASQMTSNGWNVDPTYGYPSFGSGNSQTAFNIVQLYLAYVNSTQYYNDTLFFYQSEATLHAARPFFGLAQYGIEGTVGQTATTGAPQWGLLPGDLSTPPLQNYFSQQYINTH